MVGPDSEGVTTFVSWKYNDKKERVKVVKKVKKVVEQKKTSIHVLERRKMAKFGGAVHSNPEHDRTTMESTEVIKLEVIKRTTKEDEAAGKTKESDMDSLSMAAAANTSLLVCRICGKKGDHWTSKCPYKDLAESKGISIGEKAPDDYESMGSMSMPSKGGYVPPSMRAGVGESMRMGDSMRNRRDENTIRVTNLSEDTTENDLHDLFGPFGHVQRVYIAYDKETRESRGFAFITFTIREDAQRAINKLDGFGFDNLILRVEWAAPREPKPGETPRF